MSGPEHADGSTSDLSLAVVLPTKDRPDKVRAFLASLAQQDVRLAQVIVVDSGESVEAIVDRFASDLPVEYHRSAPGQIRQRNLGIRRVRLAVDLVALFDDDIVVLPGAVTKLLDFWTGCPPETAGVAFNIVNNSPIVRSRLKELIGLSAAEPGRVLRSGMTTPNSPVSASFRSEWLCGGATVWRTDVLREFAHKEIPSRWAIAEDLVFSYPIGRQRPLFVCADAHVLHEHVTVPNDESHARFHGRTQTKWSLYFVATNADLSRLAFYWTWLLRLLGRVGRGIGRADVDSFRFALGMLEGGLAGLSCLLRGNDVTEILLSEET